MGQRAEILARILGCPGYRVVDGYFEDEEGARVEPVGDGLDLPSEARCRLILRLERRWAPRCSQCGGVCSKLHEQQPSRRWQDLTWAGRPVELEYAPVRVRCRSCDATPVEMLGFADRYQRQTRRLQHQMALGCSSAPVMHVAAQHGVSWSTVSRAEKHALARWDAGRERPPLRWVGIDEKWLGRRHQRKEKFVTIVSDLATGEPLWIGEGRTKETLKGWLSSQSPESKKGIELFVMDMHDPYFLAVVEDVELQHVAIAHDPFHVMKLANDRIDDLRREVFFRAGPELRAVGRGARWLFLRAWEKNTTTQRERLGQLLAMNGQLARAYQIKEELRAALRAPDRASIAAGLRHILRRTQRRSNVPMRKLHDSLRWHWEELLSLAEFQPPTGRVEALNTNWEALVRQGRGYRDLEHLLLKLRFRTANPVRTHDGVRRFLALGLPTPLGPSRRAA